jgi:hypothetical protein
MSCNNFRKKLNLCSYRQNRVSDLICIYLYSHDMGIVYTTKIQLGLKFETRALCVARNSIQGNHSYEYFLRKK